MDTERVDNLIAYALAVAGSEDPPRPELGPIHLIKYVYLADLHFAERHDSHTFTGSVWRFYKYGPWDAEVWKRVDPVIDNVRAYRKKIASKYGDDYERYILSSDACDSVLKRLDMKLPWEVTSTIRKFVHSFGSDTTGLLHAVYRTSPMLHASPGETLEFPARVIKETQPDSNVIPQRSAAALSKKQTKKREAAMSDLQTRIQASLAANRHASEVNSSYRPPRFDDVFQRGQEWMNDLDGAQIQPADGVLTIDGSLWKSPSRHDPDLS